MPVKILQAQEYREELKWGKRTIDTNIIFLIKLLKRLRAGYSPLILIVGKQRIGKSFIGLYIAYVFMKMVGKEFKKDKLNDFTFYDPIEAIIKLGDKELEPLIIDEAGSLLTKREWYKKSHIALDKIIQTQGYKTMLYIFISPFAIDIDKIFLKHFDFLIRVDDRGYFKTFQLFKRYDEFHQERVVRRMFLDDVYLNKKVLPRDLWKAYTEYSMEQKELMRLEAISDNRAKEAKIALPLKRIRDKMVF